VVTPQLILGLAFVTLVLSVTSVGVVLDNRARERRLREVGAGLAAGTPWGALRRRVNGAVLATRPGLRLSRRLQGAGLDVEAGDALLVVLAAAAVVTLAVRPVAGNLGALVLIAFGVAGASRWLDNRRQRRLEAFVAQLPELARVLSNATSAGLALRTAITAAAREMSEPARSELHHVSEGLALGQPLAVVLADLEDRLPSRELGVLVRTLVIQSRAGGALVTALQNIATTLEQRKELRRELRTATSGAVFSGYTVLAIAVMSVVVMNLLSPGAMDRLAQSGIGRLVLLVAGTFFATGLFLVRRLTRTDL
jgi:tight adherence protein B